jgi:multidrug resistance efflux pump
MKATNLKKLVPVLLVVVLALSALIYLVIITQNGNDEVITASGTVETVEVKIAPEFGGKVLEVLVEQGQFVEAGDVLLIMDDTLHAAQRESAAAAYDLALVNLESAKAAAKTASASHNAALAQYEVVLSSARLQEMSNRMGSWNKAQLEEINLPVWYFDQSEEIAAAEEEVGLAWDELKYREEKFTGLIAGISGSVFIEVEARVAASQVAFTIAGQVLDRARLQSDESILEIAQENYDVALAELESAQAQYNQLLTKRFAQDILEARAHLSVAQERYDTALDYHSQLLTGEDALTVRSALSAVMQAQAAFEQAEIAIEQAQSALDQVGAELDLIDVQISRLTLYAPGSGIVLTRNIEAGEIAKPGASLMTIGKLEELTITVFVSEERYGEVSLGQIAEVKVDAFPNDVFEAVVIHIADQAEYTPRNVQTEEGRRTTVFAIKLAVSNPQGKLKPGMPADVVFAQ